MAVVAVVHAGAFRIALSEVLSGLVVMVLPVTLSAIVKMLDSREPCSLGMKCIVVT
jgi:hypothetical protein